MSGVLVSYDRRYSSGSRRIWFSYWSYGMYYWVIFEMGQVEDDNKFDKYKY